MDSEDNPVYDNISEMSNVKLNGLNQLERTYQQVDPPL